MPAPLVIVGAAAAAVALWETGRAGVNWAEPYLFGPGPIELPGPPPAPAAPTSDQLRRGASWTPADVLERTRQSTRIYSTGIQAGARLSSSAAAATGGPGGGNTNALLMVGIGLAALGGVLLIRG